VHEKGTKNTQNTQNKEFKFKLILKSMRGDLKTALFTVLLYKVF